MKATLELTREEYDSHPIGLSRKIHEASVVKVIEPNGDKTIIKEARKKPVTHTKVIKGFVQAMNGHELWVNTTTDEMVKIVVNDSYERWKLYCSEVEITIKSTKPE